MIDFFFFIVYNIIMRRQVIILIGSVFLKVNVYDFDDTIYDGESVFDFYVFCLRKKPGMIRYIPSMIRALVRYKMCRITAEELVLGAEKYLKLFFEKFPNPEGLISEFWDKNMKKIKKLYLNM